MPFPLTDVLEIKPLENGDAEEVQFLGMPKEDSPESNLVYKVYDDLRKEFNLPPMSLYLYKHIPTGAGLGGGSSDAAETLKTINALFDLGLDKEEMRQRISRYGADCAFFVSGKPVYATGIGNIFEDLDINLKGYFLALVKPNESVSTKEAYSGLTPQKSREDIRDILKNDVAKWRGLLKNDFEPSVFRKHPQIAAIKETLYDMGAIYASMSGSGSAVYGIFNRPVPEVRKVFSDCFTFEKELRR